MTTPASNPRATPVWAADPPSDAATPLASLWQRFRDYYTRAREQHELPYLSDHLLRDIGVARDQLPESESRRLRRPRT